MSSQPKARFYVRISEQDFLGVTVWSGRSDPRSEVIVVQVRRRGVEGWTTVGRLAVYRSPEGAYSKLPDQRRGE